jgi:hypothetical protein
MVKNFKFFHGVIRSSLTATWTHQEEELFSINAEEELTRLMSNEIARTIDDEIIDRLTRMVNGNDNLDYFNRWIGMGGQRA